MSVSETTNVVLIAPRADWASRVQAVDPQRLRVSVLPASAFSDEPVYPPGWKSDTVPDSSGVPERDRLLQDAHVILLGLPYPTRLLSRTDNLRWVHHPNAGTSNLWDSDLWGTQVQMTSSRGSNYVVPIAESVVAGALALARGLHVGARGSMDRQDYSRNVTLAGKTMGVVGLGGIGTHVAQLSRGLGLRVLASRRSAVRREQDVAGVDELYPAAALHDMLAECDFVAICVMLTKETTLLLDAAAFAAMRPGAFVLNVARGEVIDEAAMIAALEDGTLGGAYLDVYAGELDGAPPRADLADHPRVVLTPHISGVADKSGAVGIDLFVENLREYLGGRPLRNVIDWDRGY